MAKEMLSALWGFGMLYASEQAFVQRAASLDEVALDSLHTYHVGSRASIVLVARQQHSTNIEEQIL